MSLILSGSKPKSLEIKTIPAIKKLGIKANIFLGRYEISMKDFLAAAHYVLTNTDLENKEGENDPRLRFVRNVRKMKIVDGYEKKRDSFAKRLSNGVWSLGYVTK